MNPEPTTLNVSVGDANNTTLYQPKLIGFKLAVANTNAVTHQNTSLFWGFTENQTLIKDLTETSKTKPAMLVCAKVQHLRGMLIRTGPNAKVAPIQCPSKKDIQRMKQVAKAAKETALLPQHIHTTSNPNSISKRIKNKIQDTATTPTTL